MRKSDIVKADLSEASTDLVAMSEMENITMEQLSEAKAKCDGFETELKASLEFEQLR